MTLDTSVSFILPADLLFNRGLSQDAIEVRQRKYSEDDPDTSYSIGFLKGQIFNHFVSAISGALDENWDGYGASPIDYLSVDYATSFICHLSSEIPSPEISVDNDGEIAIEWDYGPRKIFSVRIGRDGTLHYAGLVGYSTFLPILI